MLENRINPLWIRKSRDVKAAGGASKASVNHFDFKGFLKKERAR